MKLKRCFHIIIYLIIGLAVISVARDRFLRASIKKGVKLTTGLDLGIKSFRTGLINSFIKIEGLSLFNPKGFDDKVMLDVPEVFVRYSLTSAMKGRVYLPELSIHLREIIIIRNEKNELNLDSLIGSGGKSGKKGSGDKKKKLSFQIDKLKLKIGKIVYKDYSGGKEPILQEFEINHEEEYKNIKDPEKILSLIVVKAISSTDISTLIGLNIAGSGGPIKEVESKTGEAVEKTKEMLKEAAEDIKEALKSAESKTGEVVEKTKEVVKEAAEDIKGALKEAESKTGEAVEKTKELLKEAAEDIKGALKEAESKTGEAVEKTKEAVKEAAEDIKETLQQAFTPPEDDK